MTNHYKEWTRQEDERLARMLEAGVTFTECAKALGRTKGSIYARASKLRNEPKPAPAKPKRKSFLDWLLG